MSSPFDALTRVAAATHDAIMGEWFEIRPFASPADVNKRKTSDGDREIKRFRAPWGEPAARVNAGPTETVGVTPQRAAHNSARPYISLQLSLLPYRPSNGDQIFREKTGEILRVMDVLPSTPGFVRLDLNYWK